MMTLNASFIDFPEPLEAEFSCEVPDSDEICMKIPPAFRFKSKESPLYKIAQLKNNWDGEGAEKFNGITIRKAEAFWRSLESSGFEIPKPQIDPTSAGTITFTWTDQLPRKRLDIWFRGDCKPCGIEWEIESKNHPPKSGTQAKTKELIEVVREYLSA